MAAECVVDACGVLAVGRCHRCGRAFCGSHQAIGSDPRFLATYRKVLIDRCSPCEAELTAELNDNQARAYESNRSALADIADPIERVVTALGRYSSVYHESYGSSVVLQGEAQEVIRSIWPGWNGDINRYPPWDSYEVARWFAARARAVGLSPDSTAEWVTFTRGAFGRLKEHRRPPEPAWLFRSGSTKYAGGERGNQAAFVFADGRFSPSEENELPLDPHYSISIPGHLGPVALVEMARLLKLA